MFLRANGEGGIIEASFAPVAPLGLRQRRVGLENQAFDRGIVQRKQAETGRGGDQDLDTLDIERIPQSRQYAVDLRSDFVRVARVGDQQRKLVAAGSGRHVAIVEPIGDPPGGFGEQRVADGAAVELVDGVELVETDDRHREVRLRRLARTACAIASSKNPRLGNRVRLSK